MLGLRNRGDAWKVVFVLLNLTALGLAVWTIDSATRWGFPLEGVEMILAPLLGGALVIIAVLGSMYIRGGDDEETDADGTGGEDGDEDDDLGNTATKTEDEPGLEDPGDPLPDSGSEGDDDGTTSGTFAAEGFGGTSDGPGATSEGNANGAARADNRVAGNLTDTGENRTHGKLDNEIAGHGEEDDAGASPMDDTSTTGTPDKEGVDTDSVAHEGDNTTPSKEDGKIDRDLLTSTQDKEATETPHNESDGTEDDGDPLDESTVRYRHNRSPY